MSSLEQHMFVVYAPDGPRAIWAVNEEEARKLARVDEQAEVIPVPMSQEGYSVASYAHTPDRQLALAYADFGASANGVDELVMHYQEAIEPIATYHWMVRELYASLQSCRQEMFTPGVLRFLRTVYDQLIENDKEAQAAWFMYHAATNLFAVQLSTEHHNNLFAIVATRTPAAIKDMLQEELDTAITISNVVWVARGFVREGMLEPDETTERVARYVFDHNGEDFDANTMCDPEGFAGQLRWYHAGAFLVLAVAVHVYSPQHSDSTASGTAALVRIRASSKEEAIASVYDDMSRSYYDDPDEVGVNCQIVDQSSLDTREGTIARTLASDTYSAWENMFL